MGNCKREGQLPPPEGGGLLKKEKIKMMWKITFSILICLIAFFGFLNIYAKREDLEEDTCDGKCETCRVKKFVDELKEYAESSGRK